MFNNHNHNFLVVQDECHVFLKKKCEKFDALRNEYFNTWYQSGDSLQNSTTLLVQKSCTDKEMCIYINELLKLKDNEN